MNNRAQQLQEQEQPPEFAPNAPIEDMEAWEPLQQATHLSINPDVLAMAGPNGIDLDVWLNNLYVASRRRLSEDFIHLSIRRLDRSAAKDWRHFQWIKNQLVGPECEAIEIYPAESRVMDSANQYHLWCFADPKNRFQIGWNERLVMEESSMGSVQRRWPANMRPSDLKTTEQLKAMAANEEEAKAKREE
jgi:hypothetical protein